MEFTWDVILLVTIHQQGEPVEFTWDVILLTIHQRGEWGCNCLSDNTSVGRTCGIYLGCNSLSDDTSAGENLWNLLGM